MGLGIEVEPENSVVKLLDDLERGQRFELPQDRWPFLGQESLSRNVPKYGGLFPLLRKYAASVKTKLEPPQKHQILRKSAQICLTGGGNPILVENNKVYLVIYIHYKHHHEFE